MTEQSDETGDAARRSNLLPAVIVAVAALVGGKLASGSGHDTPARAASLPAATVTTPATPTGGGSAADDEPADGDGDEGGDEGDDEGDGHASTTATTVPPGPAWTYGSGPTGPIHWGELDPQWTACATGTAQSPIAVEDAIDGDAALGFVYRTTAGHITYDGRVVRIDFEPGSGITVGGVFYDLESATVHTPSEHEVFSEGFDGELQLEHRSADGHRAIVAVLLGEGAYNAALDPIVKGLDRQVGLAEPLYGPLDLAAVLPEEHSVAAYTGSVTTPPCTEDVAWFVLTEPVAISVGQLDELRDVVDETNRPLQERTDRAVTHDR